MKWNRRLHDPQDYAQDNEWHEDVQLSNPPSYGFVDFSLTNPEYFYRPPANRVEYKDLHSSSYEYMYVENLMTQENKIVVDKIQLIENPYLQELYTQKYLEKQYVFGDQVTEYLLFHGTKWHFVDSICANNFDRRMAKKHRFGWGVCFSKTAYYASQFSDPDPEICKVMIGANVLIGNICWGHSQMVSPPPGFDTSSNRDGLVVVKYDDHEYIPHYKIFYHMIKDHDAFTRLPYNLLNTYDDPQMCKRYLRRYRPY